MNAPLEPAMKRELVRSMLERIRGKNAIVRFFLRNACAKHGTPYDEGDIDVSFATLSEFAQAQSLPDNRGGGMPETPDTPVKPAEPPRQPEKSPEPRQEPQTQQVHQPAPPQQQPASMAPSVEPQPAAGTAQEQKGPSSAAKKALAALVVAGGVGGSAATGWMLGQGGDNAGQQAAAQPAAEQRWQSPYQYLEDVGAHLP